MAYDGKVIERYADLAPLVTGTMAGTKIQIRVFREQRELDLFVTVSEQSKTRPIIILGMDESTGARFWTTATQTRWEFRGGFAPELVPDDKNPCPGFTYLVIGEVPTHIPLSDDEIAKKLIEKGKDFAQRGCPSFKVSWNTSLKVNLYVEVYDRDKQPAVAAEWKQGMGQEKVSMEYRNRALEERRGRRVEGDFVTFWVDKTTGAQFGVSQQYPYLIEHEPCLFNMGSKSLVGIVPGNANLMDDSIAQGLAKRAFEEFSSFCPKLRQRASEERAFRITVSLYSNTSDKANLQAYVVYTLDASGRATLSEYKNHAQERVKQAEEQRRQAEAMARLQEQQRAEQARLAKEKADRETARQRRWDDLVRKYGIQEMIDANALTVNPFVYQGKTVAIHTHFERMVSPDTGLFADGNIMVSGLPRDLFRARSIVVLVGRVTGTTGQVPQLKFVGVHFCKDYGCSDLLAQR